MNARENQVWEWTSHYGGERVIVVMDSRLISTRHGELAMVHNVLHITGKKTGRVMVVTEPNSGRWEEQTFMSRLDG